jgi:hypothetical protein
VTWTREWIGGAAVMTIATNGTLHLIGPADKGLAGTLNNLGRVVWSDGGNIAMGGGTLNNLPGGLFEAQNDCVVYYHSGACAINNAGWMRKSAGNGTTPIGVTFNNTGTVEAQTGIIGLTVASTLGPGSTFLGAGTNLLASGVITLDGAIHSENLQLGGATAVGTGTVSGVLTWTSGWVGGGAVMTIATNGTLNIIGPTDKGLDTTLRNRGRVVWSGAGNLYLATARIENQAGATFEAWNDQALVYHSSSPVFSNAGLFRKIGSLGTTSIQSIPFDNTGTVDVQSGSLLFVSPYTQTGGRLNVGLNSLTNFGRLLFTGTAPLTGMLGANLNGGYRPRAGDAFAVVSYPARSGAFIGLDLPPLAAWQTNDTLYGATAVTLTVLNARPVLAPILDTNLDEETILNLQALADDPDPGQALTYSLPQAPAGARLDPATGAFSWTPTEAQGPSTNTITLQVTDNGMPPLTNSRTFTALVREVNRPPQWTAPPSLVVDELVLLQVPNLATDPDLPTNTLSFTLLSGPAGATVDPHSGRLAWTPTEVQGPGIHTLNIKVIDDGKPALSITNSLIVTVREVNTAPSLTVPGAQMIDELTTLLVTNRVVDADLPTNTLTFSLVSAPAGVQLDPATGVITWTPTEAQGPTNATIQVRVSDNGSPPMSDTRSFTVTVREVNAAPSLIVPGPQTIDELTSLAVTNLAADADLPTNTLTFSLVSAPAGVQLDPATGVITWTPTEAQGPTNATIQVRVTDNGTPARSDTQQFTVAVREVNTPPSLTVPGPQTIDELTTLVIATTAVDADLPNNTLTFSLASASANVQLDAMSGVITWTPTEAQGPTNATIRVRVTDNGTPARSDTQQFTVAVREVNSPPVLAPIPDQVVFEGFSLAFTNAVADPDLPTNTLTFTLVAAPAGLAMDPARGIITWDPSPTQIPSTNQITVRVTDGGVPLGLDEKTFSVAALPVPSLRLASVGDAVRIGWPEPAPGFVLQRTAALRAPIDWQEVTNAVTRTGDECLVTIPMMPGPQYFRLRRP